VYISTYTYSHEHNNIKLVAIYKIQLHVSAPYVGQPNDGLHTGPKHVAVLVYCY